MNPRDRIGLVGENGTGKSTLMKMLAGMVQPDEGNVVGPRELSFGYLPQDGLFARGHTVFEEALSVLEVYAEQDFVTHMTVWRQAVEAKLKAEEP